MMIQNKLVPTIYIAAILFFCIGNSCAESGISGKKNMPATGAFGISFHPQVGKFLYFEGVFQENLEGVTIYCENPLTGKKKVVVENTAIQKSVKYTIGPREGWLWRPGERLIIKADGRRDRVFQIPEQNSAQWNQFIANALMYTHHRSLPRQMPKPQQKNPDISIHQGQYPLPQLIKENLFN